MARPKGQPKLGGRQKGTPNKTTSETRAMLQKFFEGEIKNIMERIEEMELKDRADFLMKILPYLLPKPVEAEAVKDEATKQVFIVNGKKIEF